MVEAMELVMISDGKNVEEKIKENIENDGRERDLGAFHTNQRKQHPYVASS